TYRVNIDVQKLQDEVVRELSEVSISRPQLIDTRIVIENMRNGEFKTKETMGVSRAVHTETIRIPDLLSSIQNRTYLTRKAIFDILDASNMFDCVSVNPQQVIDEVSWTINRVKNRLSVDGIKYEKTGQTYNTKLFENTELENYLYDVASGTGAIEVGQQEKTIYDHITVDSAIEFEYMKALEQSENVKFYIKLPNWFKIDTPLGAYNPDWAVAFYEDQRIYFVSETKGSNDINDPTLRSSEVGKIKSGRRHFEELGVKFIGPTNSFSNTVGQFVKN
ncbi:MAG TPA: hypothetical protein VK983_04910, partial [Candidatus Limnocylindrales bacterium]|nr:hypothetical protein [Candidatus Limnocylindrales bacterium]